ncbi:hypothetical protein EDB84DRAFT_1444573 [Lactarius hengduanensis]|nr:hypothetical protein EDB84DRAFT_1444573 [Lactarius hengduanensis]
MPVPLVAGCDISIWRARLGEGESSECVAAGPGGVGDNVPCEFVPTLGGSGGGAITHVMHYLRKRVGPGDTDYAPEPIPLLPSSRFSHQTAPDAGLPSADEQFFARTNLTHTNGTLLLVRIIPSLVRSFCPPALFGPCILVERLTSSFQKYRTQLQSSAEGSEQFVARVTKCFEESNTQYVSSGTPNLTKLRDMRCAGTLARIELLMEHRTVVMSEGRDTDNVFVNGQVG